MKLAKALKLKNRLAGEIARLKVIIQTHNVVENGQDVVYDVKQIVNKTIPDTVNQLVMVKTAIAVANAGVVKGVTMPALQGTPYWGIFMIAELKGIVESVRNMSTKNGKFSEFRVGIESLVPVEYVASIKQHEADAMVALLQKQIDDIQDNLDGYNAGTDILAFVDDTPETPENQPKS